MWFLRGKIVLILDNGLIHISKNIQYKNRLKLVFLPPYSPELNLIKRLWKWLKQSVIHNVFYNNVDKIREVFQKFINSIDKRPFEIFRRILKNVN